MWLLLGARCVERCVEHRALGAQDQVYFRHDFGVASDTQPLPSNFEDGAKQLWRTPLQPRHSTPCVYGDFIFLTTFQAEEKDRATVALDGATGEVRWRQVMPTKNFELVHATGSPATPTPAYTHSASRDAGASPRGARLGFFEF